MADVSTPASEYLARQEYWAMARALLGGTRAMVDAGEKYLTRFEAESDNAFRRRLQASVLHAGFGSIVKSMSGLPFSRDIIFGEDVPEEIAGKRVGDGREKGALVENIDGRGTHVQTLAGRVFREGLALGSSAILVDMPASRGVTAADDRRARPVWRHYAPECVLDARRERLADGHDHYTHVRLKERVRTFQGYEEVFIEQVREIEPGGWKLWRKGEKGEWQVVEEGAYELPLVAFVPFLAGGDAGDFTANSPLENCAYLNRAHWNSSSDQRHILTFSRFAMLVATGMEQADFKIGPMTIVSADNENARLELLEPQGTAIAAGERDLKALEEQMDAEGLKLLVREPAAMTATQRVLDDSKDQSELELLAKRFSSCLEKAADYTMMWLGEEEGHGGSIEVSTDFGFVENAQQVMQTVLQLRQNGDLSHEDELKELQRAGIISETLDIPAAIERAKKDMMGRMGAFGASAL